MRKVAGSISGRGFTDFFHAIGSQGVTDVKRVGSNGLMRLDLSSMTPLSVAVVVGKELPIGL